MNFQYIAPIEKAQSVLDLAFRKARERSRAKKIHGSYHHKIKTKELIKLDVVASVLIERWGKIITSFPQGKSLPHFYQELIKLTLDETRLRYALKGLDNARRTVKRIHKLYAGAIGKSADKLFIEDQARQFYGRIASVVQSLENSLKILEHSRHVMRSYPDIKEMYTICIYGFPNVGKSTLLNTLTTSKAKIATYAFTTKSINVGYGTFAAKKVQLLDVPGTLNRGKANDIEKQAELALEELACAVIYVFDLTENCGYSLQDQIALYRKVKELKKTWVYVSKKDITQKAVLERFRINHCDAQGLRRAIALSVKEEQAGKQTPENKPPAPVIA